MSSSSEKRDSSALDRDVENGGAAFVRSDSEVEKEGGNLLLTIAEGEDAGGLKLAKDGKVRSVFEVLSRWEDGGVLLPVSARTAVDSPATADHSCPATVK